MAQKLSNGITAAGHTLAAQTESNQIFPILPNTIIDVLQETFDFYIWEKVDDQRSVIRLVTSWATDEEQVDSLIGAINETSA